MQTAKQAATLTIPFSILVSKTLLSMLPGPHSFGLATYHCNTGSSSPSVRSYSPDAFAFILDWYLSCELCQDWFPHRKPTGFVPGPTGGIHDVVPIRLGEQLVAVV
jgi:hypothetical protein